MRDIYEEIQHILADSAYYDLPIRVEDALRNAHSEIAKLKDIIRIERESHVRVSAIIDECANRLNSAYNA